MKMGSRKKTQTKQMPGEEQSNSNHIKHININSNKGNYYNAKFSSLALPFNFEYMSLCVLCVT